MGRKLGLFGKGGPALLWHDHGIVRYWWLAKLFNGLDLSIANSDFERNKLMANGLRPEKVVRIHNGIDIARLDVSAEEVRPAAAEGVPSSGCPMASPWRGSSAACCPRRPPMTW